MKAFIFATLLLAALSNAQNEAVTAAPKAPTPVQKDTPAIAPIGQPVEAPSAPKKPTTTTTPKPKTTTTPAPVPTTTPMDVANDYTVKIFDATTNELCFIANFTLDVIVKVNGTQTDDVTLAGNELTQQNSNCDVGGAIDVAVMGKPSNSSNNLQELNLQLTFGQSSDNSSWSLTNVTYSIAVGDGSSMITNSKQGLSLFKTPAGKSYSCNAKTALISGTAASDKAYDVEVDMMDAKIEAFTQQHVNHTSIDNFSFATAQQCQADMNTSTIVPIAVGIALAALVIIVLVAYLIGRRKARARGYESM